MTQKIDVDATTRKIADVQVREAIWSYVPAAIQSALQRCHLVASLSVVNEAREALEELEM